MDLKKTFFGLCEKASKYSPEILVGFGISGFVTATILAVRATPKAEDLIIHAEDEKEDSLTVVETVQAAWKPFLPSLILTGVSAGCVIGAMKIKTDRNAELAMAYALSQAMATQYRKKTEELVGKEKAKEIDDSTKKELITDPMVRESVTKMPLNNIAGVHPFKDLLSNSEFYASFTMMKNAEIELNRRLYTGSEPYVTVDDWYDELNEQGVYPPLKHTGLSGDHGWTADNGGIELAMSDDGVPFEQSHWNDGTPCYVVSFRRCRCPEYIR